MITPKLVEDELKLGLTDGTDGCPDKTDSAADQAGSLCR